MKINRSIWIIPLLLWVGLSISAQSRYIFAQPDSMEVRWMYYPQDTTAIDDTIIKTFHYPHGERRYYQELIDGRRRLYFSRGLIDGDSLYVMYCTGYFEIKTGTFLEKLNIRTGQSYWTERYDGRTMDASELPQHIYKDKEGHIVILGFRGDYYGYKNSRFYKRVYDGHTGTLLRHTYGEMGRPNTPQLKFSDIYRWSHLYPHGDSSYTYFSNEHSYYNWTTFEHHGPQMLRYELDEFGHKLDSSGIIITEPARYYFQFLGDIMPLNDTTMVVIRFGRNTLFTTDTTRREYHLEFLSKDDLHSIRSVDISTVFDSTLDGSQMHLERVTPEYIIVFLSREKKPRRYDQVIGIFDHEGRVLDRIVIDSVPGAGDLRPTTFSSVFYKSKEEVYLASTVFIKRERKFDLVLMSKKFGEKIKVIGRWRINKPDAEMLPRELIPLEGGDFLIKFRYHLFKLNSKTGVYSGYLQQHIWGRISGDALVAGVDLFTPVLGKSYEIRLSPNPSDGYSSVLFDHPFSGSIAMVDGLGEEVYRSALHRVESVQLPLQGMLAGTYYVRAVEEDGTVYHGKLVVR